MTGINVTGMIRVVVVDDEPMVCAHLRTILGSAPDIEVVDEAHDGAAGVTAVVRNRPDVVLMDLRMHVLDGIAAIERIVKLADPPVVVVLTTFDADQYVLRATSGSGRVPGQVHATAGPDRPGAGSGRRSHGALPGRRQEAHR